MKLIIIISMISMIGCATANEYCSDPDHLARYKDYNQCYAERQAALDRFHNSMSHMGDGLQNSSQNNVQCTTTGSPGFYTTNCR